MINEMPSSREFTLVSIPDPDGKVYVAGDAQVTRKNNPAKVGDVKQVTGYKLGKKTYTGGDQMSVKVEGVRYRWLKSDLNDHHKLVFKVLTKKAKFNKCVDLAKMLKANLIGASIGNKKIAAMINPDIVKLTDYVMECATSGTDTLLNRAGEEDSTPVF